MTKDLFRLLWTPADDAVHLQDPASLVERASVHGLSGVVHHSLRARGQPLPGGLDAQLQRDGRAIAGQGLKLRMLLARTLRAMAAEDVVPVVLKGFALGHRIYPDALLRPSTDVDVLVREAELEATERAMKSLKLAAQEAATRAYFREHHHHLTFQGAAGMVEVHFRLIVGFGAAVDWADLREPLPASLDELRFRRLQPEDELCYLALHAAQHVFARLSWVYDLQRFIETEPRIDWSRVVALAEGAGFAVPLWAALKAAHDCFGARVPPQVLQDLRPSRARAATLSALLSPDRLHDGFFQERRNLYAAQLLMTATANRALRFAGHHAARAAKRRLALRFPGVAPSSWRG